MRPHFLQSLLQTFTDRANGRALVYRERSLSYGELERLVCQRASWLHEHGLQPGDRVAFLTADKWAFIPWHLAAIFAGGISLPLNPRFTPDEVRFFLQDSGAKFVIAGDEQRPAVESLRGELPELREAIYPASDWEPTPNRQYKPPDVSADDACLILYSSGTTGRPKGVVHTHANLAASLQVLADCWRFSPDDVLVNVLPLFHIHGLSFATHLSLMCGSCMLIDDAFHPQRTLDLIGQGTVFMGIPTFYYSLLERRGFAQAARGWSHVRLFTCGSAPFRPEVLGPLEEILRRPVINRYGMTEGHVLTSLPLDGPWPHGSVGLPLAGIELRITGEQDGPAATGEIGRVMVRGPNLFREYWRQPAATDKALAGGWFETGDLGSLDENGFLTLAGRTHDLIITSGFNVYPQVVERVINACDGVAESAVVGVADDRRGERVVAMVVRSDPQLDATRVRDFCRERLVDYQRPAAVLFVDSLPRNALGKVLRRELAQLAAQML